MNSIKVVNIKCGGCEAGIIFKLTNAGFKNVSVDIENQIINFDGEIEKAKIILTKMGYPETGTSDAKSFTKKAKSYVSCMIGKMKK
ncbi:MAG: heavy metal transporter [Patescibacteria group bacterium]|nr:heavy metal transporter [Patescibacteria group bacterium]MDD4304483.1 heavy metal transporter [Patescibacteria group bacterium]MDD4694843.1 heavy metal transporter [Patescibacteria group bacterium]